MLHLLWLPIRRRGVGGVVWSEEPGEQTEPQRGQMLADDASVHRDLDGRAGKNSGQLVLVGERVSARHGHGRGPRHRDGGGVVGRSGRGRAKRWAQARVDERVGWPPVPRVPATRHPVLGGRRRWVRPVVRGAVVKKGSTPGLHKVDTRIYTGK